MAWLAGMLWGWIKGGFGFVKLAKEGAFARDRMELARQESDLSKKQAALQHEASQRENAELKRDVAQLRSQNEVLKLQVNQKDALIESQRKTIEELEKRLHDLELPKELDECEKRILEALSRRRPANAHTLAELLDDDTSEIEYRLQRMLRLGLVRSDSGSMDGRGNDYGIDFKGREWLHKKGGA